MANLGSLTIDLALESAQFIAGAKRAAAQMEATGKSIQSSINFMKNAATGLAAALAVDAFVDAAGRAFDYADSIVDLSQKTGVATKTIQEFRYAAQLSGSSFEDADAALGKFAKNIGDAQRGGDSMANTLKSLGITTTDTDAALKQAIEGISKLPTLAERNSAAMQLFGKSAASLTGLLSQGSKGYNELANEAERLGIVLGDDLLQNAGQVNDQMDRMKMIVNAQFAGAVIQNADALGSMAGSVISLSSAMAKFWGQNPEKAFAIMGALGGAAVGARLGPWGALAGAVAGGIGGKMFGRDVREQTYQRNDKWRATNQLYESALANEKKFREEGASIATTNRFRKIREKALAERRRLEDGIDKGSITIGDLPSLNLGDGGGGGGDNTNLRTPTGKTKPSPKAKQAHEKTDAQLDLMWRREFLGADSDLLSARRDLSTDPTARADAEKKRLRNDYTYRASEIKDDTGTDKEIREGKKRYTEKQAEQLQELENEIYDARYDSIERDRLEEIARQKLQMGQAGLQLEIEDQASLQSLARSSSERRAIGLKLVDLEYRKEKLSLDAIVASQTATQAEKDIAQARLAILDKLKSRDTARVERENAGPMATYLDNIPQTAGEINDQMENVAINGLESLNDGLLDAIMGVGSLKDAFADMTKGIVSGLVKIALQQMIIKPLGSLLFGGGDSGGGGLFGSLIKSVLPAVAGQRANGGMTQAGDYLVGERGPEVVRIGNSASVVNATDTRAIAGANTGKGGVNITFGDITSNDPAAIRAAALEAIGAALPTIRAQAADYTIQKLQRRGFG